MLTASDADMKLGRIVIPKRYAEAFFPEVSAPKGIMMNILDMESKEWEFSFRYWPNCGSKTYVLEGLRDFMFSRKLQAGDTVSFYRVEPGERWPLDLERLQLRNQLISEKAHSSLQQIPASLHFMCLC